jgi:hypothetical protein
VEADRELMLVDTRSISQGLWRIARLTQDAAESLDARIEEDLDGATEAEELREALSRAYLYPFRSQMAKVELPHVG